MGSDCPPNVAGLFLFIYEFDFVSKMVELGDAVLRKLKFCGRYIDDLSIPNADNKVMNIVVNNIYPKELEIVDNNPSNNNKATFLDLEIEVSNGKFSTKLYDKRKDFPFNVIRMPNLRSNVPNKYGIFVGELYRIAKSSSKLKDFISEVKCLLKQLLKQNFSKLLLIRKLK